MIKQQSEGCSSPSCHLSDSTSFKFLQIPKPVYRTTSLIHPCNSMSQDYNSQVKLKRQQSTQMQIDLGQSDKMHKIIQLHFQQFADKIKEKEEDEDDIMSFKRSSMLLQRKISLLDDTINMDEEVELPSFVAWGLLLFCLISNAMVPCWLTVDVQSESFTRNSWRFLTMAILQIPFVAYEQRNTKDQSQSFRALLKLQNLQNILLCSINYCVFVGFGVYACKLTSKSHSFCLIRLKFLIMAIRKFIGKKKYHQFQVAGTMLTAIGIFMIFWDSFKAPQVYNKSNQSYHQRSNLYRLLGDSLALLGSVVCSYLDQRYTLPKVAKFSNLFLYNILIVLTLITFGYFLGGNEFSFHPKYGVFGMFTSVNFASIFYVSIMLGLNIMIGSILVEKMFSELIRNIAGCFQIIITTTVYHALNIEVIYGGLSCLGFSFIVPGMMLVVGGQNFLAQKELKMNFLVYQRSEIEGNSKKLLKSLLQAASDKSLESPQHPSLDIISEVKDTDPTHQTSSSDPFGQKKYKKQ